MPTYEYRCTDCSNEFELFQKMSDKPEALCPKCSAPSHRRISGGAGLVFKGSGFYITDYARGEGYRKAAKEEGGGSDAAAPKADAPAAPSSGASTPSSGTGGTSAKSE